MSRQQQRRELFTAAFADMPLWETWQDERSAPTETDPERTKLVGNFTGIGRAKRREMARKFSKRQWRGRTA